MKLRRLIISLSEKCNLRCIHCSVSAGAPLAKEIDVGILKRSIGEARELGAETIVLTGGEPFLYENVWDVIDYALDLGFRIGVESNGTLLEKGDLVRISRINNGGQRLHLSISLDGIEGNVHDRLRGIRGAGDRTIKSLEYAHHSKVSVQVLTVLNALNTHQVEKITDFATKLGHTHRIFFTILRLGRGADLQPDLRLTPRQTKEFIDAFYSRKDVRNQTYPYKVWVDAPVALIPPDVNLFSFCDWGRSIIGVTPGGKVGLCHDIDGFSELSVGDIAVESLEKLYNRLLAKDWGMMNCPPNFKGICGNCLAVKRCRGKCRIDAFANYGDLGAPYPPCQEFYDAGVFPEHAQIDPAKAAFYKEDP